MSTGTTKPFSVVIPAYNEGAVIERSLRTLLGDAAAGEVEAVVVCNACEDDTAERARAAAAALGYPVTVLETDTAGKTHALNLGDEHAATFPRLYVDADVTLATADARRVVAALREPGVRLATPRMVTDTAGRPWGVRAYYRTWQTTPYYPSHVGGVYGLSAEGRQRFGVFPTIIADDDFVRTRFAPNERRSLADASFTVQAPRRFGDLLRIKTRSRLGAAQREATHPATHRPPNHSAAKRRWMAQSAVRFWRWPDQAAYLVVAAVTRRRARQQAHTLDQYVWERDLSTRTTTHDPGKPGKNPDDGPPVVVHKGSG